MRSRFADKNGIAMLSILVCHSYFLRLDQKQVARAKPYPPLATLQVVDLLRRAGHRVAFFDAMLADGIDEYDRLLRAEQPSIVLFYEDNFNYLSKMCLATMRTAACEMIGKACSSGARVISAGPDVTDSPKTYLRAGAELALIGEGLTALLALLPRADLNPDILTSDWIKGIAGVAAQHGAPVTTAIAARPSPLTAEPGAAAWDLVDMAHYRRVWTETHGYFSLNMAASRGCSFRCTWCAKPIWGNQYLQRDPAEVAEEMRFLKRSFAPDHVWFADDIFGFRVDWVEKFAAAAEAADCKIPFTIQTRADLVSDSMARALQRAGCREAWIGAESGSQRVLDAMNKGTTIAEILLARERLRNVGIRVGFFIQLGYLDEQLDDILATRDLLAAAQPDEIGVSVSYPLPRTKFFDLVQAQMGSKTHWQDSNDLAMMFRGTYQSDFYRVVRNLLHDQISMQSESGPGLADSLHHRWQALLTAESEYRSLGRSAVGA
jgi:anaerobic magnesium-protoporphyrin IX monomethyl ester cyclase